MVAPPLAGKTIGSLNSDFVIAEWRDEGGVSEQPRLIAPPHRHHRDDEAWVVLEGTLHLRVDSEIVIVHAGAGVFVPRGAVHTFWNPGPGPVRYLLVMTPNILRLITAIHAMKDRSAPRLKALFQEHDSELMEA